MNVKESCPLLAWIAATVAILLRACEMFLPTAFAAFVYSCFYDYNRGEFFLITWGMLTLLASAIPARKTERVYVERRN